MTRILSTIHLSDIQKEVLAKVKAAPTPHVAWSAITDTAAEFDENFATARDVLGNLGLLKVGDGTLEVTDKGLEVMNDENLTDEIGELTDTGRALADTPREEYPQAQQLTPPPGGEEGMGGLPMESLSLIRAVNNNLDLPRKLQLTEGKIPVTHDVVRMVISDVKKFLEGTTDYYNLPDAIQSIMLSAFSDTMPYGVQKARTGTPDQWLLDQDPSDVVNVVRSHLDAMRSRGESIWV